MCKKLKLAEVLGQIFVIVCGTFLHFAYAWSNQNTLFAFFVPTNESVFEHLKLLFFPFWAYTVAEYFYVGIRYKNFIFIKSIACLIGLFFIPTAFRFYTHFAKKAVLTLDILIFAASVFLSFWISFRMASKNRLHRMDLNAYGIFLFAFTMLLFFLCTLFPPNFWIFIA